MTTFARTDNSLVARWWRSVDHWSFAGVFLLVAFGAVLALAASPPVAERIGFGTYYFVKRQFVFLLLGVGVMVTVSLLSPMGVRRVALGLFAAALGMMVLVPIVGTELNGATRWLSIAGVSVQPSEFAKPAFAVLVAWALAAGHAYEAFPGRIVAAGLFAVVAGLLLVQPDVGMTIVVAAVWGVEMFIAGLPLVLVALVAVGFLTSGVAAYFVFPHVQARVDRFLDPAADQGYQVARGLEALRNGGLFGRGPGEGLVKTTLPDAHTDFILAVVGEEFGVVACLIVVSIFAFILLRGFARVLRERDLFVLLGVAGLMTVFSLQAIINMASTVHLMPPKGMTLPFLSYGGSSVLALAIGMGMVLALTRRRTGGGDAP